MTGDEIATAFMAHNDKVAWQARCIPQPQGDVVYFTSTQGMIQLEYDVPAERWSVKFNRVQAKWGDYTGSIARSFINILTTLKAAGLPFDAPVSVVGTIIETELGPDGKVFVKWRGPDPIWDTSKWPKDFPKGNVVWRDIPFPEPADVECPGCDAYSGPCPEHDRTLDSPEPPM